MADKKIVDLDAIVTQATTDLYEVSGNGLGSFKETRAQQKNYWDINLFSPANVIYVAANGNDSTGTGTFLNPYRLISRAITAAVDNGVAPSSPILIVVQEGNYTEVVDLSLVRPGLFTYLQDGVRLTMTNKVITSAGWAGILGGVTGLNNFKPLDFAGAQVAIPSDAAMLWYLDNNNWNALTDNPSVTSANTSDISFIVANNSDLFIADLTGFDTTLNNSRGFLIVNQIQNYQDSYLRLNGGSVLQEVDATVSCPSGTPANLHIIIKDGRIDSFNFLVDHAGSGDATYQAGQVGVTNFRAANGGTTPKAIILEDASLATADGDMVTNNWSRYIDNDLASNPRLNVKVKKGANLLKLAFGTKELFVPVTPLVANRPTLSPNTKPFICGQLDNTGGTAVVLTGQIPFDGATSIVDILVEGFTTGMGTTGMAVVNACSWAALGEADNLNANSGTLTLNPNPDNKLARYSIKSLFTGGSTALALGDIIGVSLTTATAAKVLYVTGLVILYT